MLRVFNAPDRAALRPARVLARDEARAVRVLAPLAKPIVTLVGEQILQAHHRHPRLAPSAPRARPTGGGTPGQQLTAFGPLKAPQKARGLTLAAP